MKRIYFVRHAKSSWKFPELSDKERPLNKRGKRDAPRMAAFISGKINCPDTFISSPAVRAFETAKNFISAFNVRSQQLQKEEELYHAWERDWIDVIHNLDQHQSSAMLFGHNPGITDIVNDLSDSNIYNIPTCGVAAVYFETDSWKKISNVRGKLEFYYFPKGI